MEKIKTPSFNALDNLSDLLVKKKYLIRITNTLEKK
jgi:hypothetical protein